MVLGCSTERRQNGKPRASPCGSALFSPRRSGSASASPAASSPVCAEGDGERWETNTSFTPSTTTSNINLHPRGSKFSVAVEVAGLGAMCHLREIPSWSSVFLFIHISATSLFGFVPHGRHAVRDTASALFIDPLFLLMCCEGSDSIGTLSP